MLVSAQPQHHVGGRLALQQRCQWCRRKQGWSRAGWEDRGPCRGWYLQWSPPLDPKPHFEQGNLRQGWSSLCQPNDQWRLKYPHGRAQSSTGLSEIIFSLRHQCSYAARVCMASCRGGAGQSQRSPLGKVTFLPLTRKFAIASKWRNEVCACPAN